MSTLPARRIGGILMDLDMPCVEGTKLSMSIRGHCVEDLRPTGAFTGAALFLAGTFIRVL